MALIPCPECQHEVSDRAIFCPVCGFAVTDRGVKVTKVSISFDDAMALTFKFSIAGALVAGVFWLVYFFFTS